MKLSKFLILFFVLDALWSCSESYDQSIYENNTSEDNHCNYILGDYLIGVNEKPVTRVITPGSLVGVIYWNCNFNYEAFHTSRITIGLLDGPTLAANIVASITDNNPTFPYEFDFQDVPDGKYWVFSFMDVGEPNDVSVPGPGDRLVITEGDVFILRSELSLSPAVLALQ